MRPGEADVLRDHEQRQPASAAQREQQVQYLRTHRDVERRDRLIADEACGLGCDRAGDRDALPLPARELVRVAMPEALGGREARILERGRGAQHTLVARPALHAQGLLHELAHAHARVERFVADPGRPSAACDAACECPRDRASHPRSEAPPALGCSRPSSVRASVVLPQPDSPTTPSTSFRRHSRSTPSSARTTRPRPR